MQLELAFIQNLYIVSGNVPEFENDISMGCPYDDELVEFFERNLVEKDIIEVIGWFIKAEEKEDILSISLQKNCSRKD